MTTPRELLPAPLPFSAAELDVATVTGGRSVKRRARQGAFWKRWANESVAAINELFGHGDLASSEFTSSLGQRRCMERVTKACQGFGAPPPLSPAEAFIELCGQRPGSYSEAARGPQPYRREALSLPAAAGTCTVAEEVLRGRDLTCWQGWSQHLLRTKSDAAHQIAASGISEPYLDSRLRSSRRHYAQFVGDLLSRGLLSFQ